MKIKRSSGSKPKKRISKSPSGASILRDLGLGPRHARAGRLLVQGMAYKQIAIELGKSLHTIESYVEELYRATGCHSRFELIQWSRARPGVFGA
jgi:DNA-binding NarL/FixJ family response regulator